MLHYVIIGGLIILVLACVVILFSIRPEDEPRNPKLPPDLRPDHNDRTHFYKAVSPERGLPPVPPVKRARHAVEEPKTDIVYYGPVASQPSTRLIPRVR